MKKIPLKGKYGTGLHLLIDDEDYALISQYSWHLSKHGYPSAQEYKITKKIRAITLHRILLPHKKGYFIDHINRNKLDNQRNNLRYVNFSQSVWNTGKTTKVTSSLYKGVVHFNGSLKNPWKVEIMRNGKRQHIGLFPTEKIAALAYDLWAADSDGEYVNTNFPLVSHTKRKPLAQ